MQTFSLTRLALFSFLVLSLSLPGLHGQVSHGLPSASLKLKVSPSVEVEDGLLCVASNDVLLSLYGVKPGWPSVLLAAPHEFDLERAKEFIVPLAMGLGSSDHVFSTRLEIPPAARGMKYLLMGIALNDAHQLQVSKVFTITLD